MKTTVLKFGGTSLADAAQIRKAVSIVRADPARRYIVVSAPGKRDQNDIKVTDMLLECWRLAHAHADFEPVLSAVEKRFLEIINGLGISFDLSTEISVIRGMLRAMPARDYMASRGEYLNAKIIATYMELPFIDPADCIFFHMDGTLKEVRKEVLTQATSAVIAGFYGARPDGTVQVFSRGGSDVTGALVAAAVDADLYENWTDVSGLLTADPNVVDHPRTVDYISYRELRVLSYMGASVLHTDAVYPVRGPGIPVHIRNTNHPEEPGTVIVRELPSNRATRDITGIAGRKGLSVVQVEKNMVSDGAGFTAVLLDIFRDHRVPFEQCLTGIDTVSLVVRTDLLAAEKTRILRDIREKMTPDILNVLENLAMITVVGENVSHSHDISSRILAAVAAAGVPISTVNQGAGKLNLILGVAEKDYERTLRAIHDVIASDWEQPEK